VLNEREGLEEGYRRLRGVFDSLAQDYRFEVVYTDNHSTDGTFDAIALLAASDTRIRAYRFSRNFGYQRSILEAYRHCRGDAAIQIDADLQDPPELIPVFLGKWREGAHVVFGVRTKRKEGALINAGRKVFYRLIDVLSEDPLPWDAGDFRLVDRKVLDVLSQLDDAQPYLRGTIAAMGFEQVGVPYERDARTYGESKFPLRQMIALSVDGILNHSVTPLRVATFTGLAISLLTFLGIVMYLVGRLFFGQDWPAGFATTTALILLAIGLNGLFLGVIGEYLGRIYKQVKRGPNTIIERSIENDGEHA
jgi:dolichol-phosphate mannosyltransferase